MKEIFSAAVDSTDEFDELLAKFPLMKAIRVIAWIRRFVFNCRAEKETRHKGPLITEEINSQHTFWIQRAQSCQNDQISEDKQRLNVESNDVDGVMYCKGRLQGEYPIYLPDVHPYTKSIVRDAHERTLHGGVGLTMTKVRERYWVPRQRQLVKKVLNECFKCRRFRAKPIARPPVGNLPRDRTEGTRPFQVVGVDFAGPIKYRVLKKTQGKAYVTLFACSLCRAIYLELTKTMETSEFLRSLKRLIARKGRPNKIYSDNAGTFAAAAAWLSKVQFDEQFQNHLANKKIHWQFNLSRAPWWGGQFERLVGLVKRALYKSIGNSCLGWDELQDVLLDIEVTLNNRPLGYQEDDIELPTLTPNSLQFVGTTVLPELEPHNEKNRDLRKRARYLKKCKDHMWKRWSTEYLRALREKHNLKHHGKQSTLLAGEVVIIASDERNRGKWTLGIVEKLFPGRDGVIRAAKVKTSNGHLERAVNHLYPLELSCDQSSNQQTLNPTAPVFRPVRDAAVAARSRIQKVTEIESQEQV